MKMIEEAFLLSAGLGTRLKPLTDILPKPLVPLCAKPLMQWNLELLKSIGVKKVIVNVHYKRDLLIAYLKSKPVDGLEYIISEEETLLDTGGGLKKILPYIEGERFFTWNSDVVIDPRVSSVDKGGLKELIELSLSSIDPDIALLVREVSKEQIETYSELGFDVKNRLIKFLGKNYYPDQNSLSNLTNFNFLGISIMRSDISRYFPENMEIFSLTKDIFPELLKNSIGAPIGGIYGSPCNCYWNDVGTPSRLEEASKEIGNILPLL